MSVLILSPLTARAAETVGAENKPLDMPSDMHRKFKLKNYFDLTFAGQFRSYPVAGEFEVESGLSAILWGKKDTYNRGRLRLGLDAGLEVNRTSATLMSEFFPVSFLGLRYGVVYSQSSADYLGYDCNAFACEGQFQEQYYQVPLFVFYKKYSGAISYKVSKWPSGEQDAGGEFAEFVDPGSGLALASVGSSEVSQLRYIFYKKMNAYLSLGYLSARFASAKRGVDSTYEESHLQLIMALLKVNKVTLSAGLGTFESPIVANDVTGFLKVAYTIQSAP